MSTEENKSVVRRYFEEVNNQRKLAVIDEIIAPDLAEPTRGAVGRVAAAFPDYHISITDQIAEGDKVATVWTLTGTHQGEWMSPMGAIAPTGKQVTYTATTTLRIADGKIAEVIGTNHDHLGLLQQMGALPATAPRPGA
ncbi:MAG: ester cyclase [Chloroflexota bacterium]|nr:ester cyclase [Chloroflexota bacterium]